MWGYSGGPFAGAGRTRASLSISDARVGWSLAANAGRGDGRCDQGGAGEGGRWRVRPLGDPRPDRARLSGSLSPGLCGAKVNVPRGREAAGADCQTPAEGVSRTALRMTTKPARSTSPGPQSWSVRWLARI